MKALVPLCSIALLACALDVAGKDGKLVFPANPTTNTATLELKGRLVGATKPLQFKADSGFYTLVSNRMSSALFIDTNFRSKTLLLKGRALPGRRFEVTGNLRSVRDGKVQELYYYCDVCAVKGIEPGPCMCCREPVHLIEEPESDSKK